MEEIQQTAKQTAHVADVPSFVEPQKEEAEGMSRFNRVVEGIDADLAYLHKQRWALEAADLRDVIDRTTGPEQDSAKQALREHYKTQFHPETSRAALVQQAWANHQAREQVVENIDANLASLHKELWTLEAAQLHDLIGRTEGAEKEHAQQALRDHSRNENDPQTSRAALVRQAVRQHYRNLYGDDPETSHAALVQQVLLNHQAQHPA